MHRHAPLFRAAACGAVCLCAVGAAGAQVFPAKAVRIIVPYAAGGPLDEFTRVLAQRLNDAWGQPVIADSRPGASGGIAAELVAKAAPDGYTLLLGNPGPITVFPNLQKRASYNPQTDLAPVTMMVSVPLVLVAHPSLPARNARDLVRLARARPGQVTFASAGVGNLAHIAMESLSVMAGVKMNHIPYKGSAPALVDIMAGHVDMMLINILGLLPHVQSGRVRAIGVSSAKRTPVYPDAASIAEFYPEFDVTSWVGIFAPAATPRETVAKLHGDIARVLARAELRDRIVAQGAEIVAGTPEALGAHVKRESAIYAKAIQAAGIRVD
jgi:tripartite-type tricarboxylate transporter receptor subunit TctC